MDRNDLRARLLKLDTCVVSDALDRLGIAGVVTGLARLSTDQTVAGRVLTVRLEAAEGRTAERHLCTGAVEAADAGDVVVVEHHARADCAGWGGILSCAAAAKGLSGVIVDGLCRDVDESRRFGFPVFARGAVPRTARGRVIETAFNVPVVVEGVTVAPGDWVLADGSGIAFLPGGRAEEIVEVAEGLAAREEAMLLAVRAGTPVGSVMAGNYERMLVED